MQPPDWEDVRRIYAEGIASGHATFETEPPGWAEWNEGHLADCRFVAVLDEAVVGWAALSPVSDRCVYAGVAEVSVYVDDEARGRGVGGKLMEALVGGSEEQGIWTLQAGVFPENEASVRVHTRVGFRLVGRRERLGQMDGVWRDVFLLERRSQRVGVNENPPSLASAAPTGEGQPSGE
jgi:phosphinothricin acetyltransferase